MAGDNTDSSFWKSYQRRLRRIRNDSALSRSRELISRLPRPNRGRLGLRGTSVTEDSPCLPFSVSSSGGIGVVSKEDSSQPTFASTAGSISSRYQLAGMELGRGGMGKVVVAFDQVLRRQVALKVPLPEVSSDPGILAAFLAESRLTSRLEHPNIVPVYDLVQAGDGSYGYVMRRVQGERFSEILRGLQRGDPARVDAYGRVRLLTIFSQVVTAVAYAHDSRVIHRDLKPNNIMIGSYGEVLLLDWGLARTLSDRSDERAPLDLIAGSSSGFIGAPAYISPEQLAGDHARVDERSDVYSLGAILYEILTLTPPHQRGLYEDEEQFIDRIRTAQIEPPSVRAPERRIPPALEEICMKCLMLDRDARYQSAMEIHHDVAVFLEGTREQEWRRKAAEARAREALAAAARYESLRAEAVRCQQEADVARNLVNPWDPIERKREGWNLQQLAAQADEAAMVAFSEAEKAFHQALGHDHGYRPALDGMADLYWRRFIQAEASRNLGEMRYFEARVQTFDEAGRYTIRLKGDGRLILETEPSGAEVTLYTYREVDCALRPVNPRDLGRSPLKTVLPVGSYLVRIRHPGFRDVEYPVCVSRLETIDARVRLYTEEDLGPDFIYVPAGPFRMGGDPEAYNPEVQNRWLEDFAIGRLPITAGQYLEFVNDLVQRDPDEARRRAPRKGQDPTPLWPRGSDGLYQIPDEEDEEGHRWLPDFPIFYISWDDAVVYAAWRGKQDKRAYRLPTAEEWEKAARGVDGRFFPWGDRFEPTFCKNRDSKQGALSPEPVGRYPQDVSPYGVQDMAGGVADWTADWLGGSREMRLTLGGTWTRHERGCRLARKVGYRQEGTNVTIGFRLCFSLTRPW